MTTRYGYIFQLKPKITTQKTSSQLSQFKFLFQRKTFLINTKKLYYRGEEVNWGGYNEIFFAIGVIVNYCRCCFYFSRYSFVQFTFLSVFFALMFVTKGHSPLCTIILILKRTHFFFLNRNKC